MIVGLLVLLFISVSAFKATPNTGPTGEMLFEVSIVDRPSVPSSPSAFNTLSTQVDLNSNLVCHTLPSHAYLAITCDSYDNVLGFQNCAVQGVSSGFAANSTVSVECTGTPIAKWQLPSVYQAKSCADLPAGTVGLFNFGNPDSDMYELDCFSHATLGENWSRLSQGTVDRFVSSTCRDISYVDHNLSYNCGLDDSPPTTHCGCGLDFNTRVHITTVHLIVATNDLVSTSSPGVAFQFSSNPNENSSIHYHYDDHTVSCSAGCNTLISNNYDVNVASFEQTLTPSSWGYIHFGMRAYTGKHFVATAELIFK